MKFSLFSVLLLVPLALAKPTALSAIKMLFHDGFLLTEGFDAREIRHLYYQDKLYLFTKNNGTKYGDSMDLKRDLIKQSEGFAIEVYLSGPDYLGDKICMKNSNKQLKYLIDKCSGNIRMRMLTKEERNQLEEYKKSQKESKKPFEVLYDQKRTIIKSSEIAQLAYEDRLGSYDHHTISFSAKLNLDEEAHSVFIVSKIADKSFVIEGLPADSKENCGKIGLEDIDMLNCKGQIILRPKY